MSQTTKLGLVLTPISDTAKNFRDYRDQMSGTGESNMKKIDAALGAPNGIAELDSNGHVLASQLPSFVDDVLEFANLAAFPATGESGKIYIAVNTNITYRWTGSIYTAIGSDLALGTTSSTAYRGDHGLIAYNHSQAAHAPTGAQANQTVTAGAGMNFTATSGNVTITMGAPGSLTGATTNSASGTTHTHAVTLTATNVGLGNVTNESKATMFTSPTFTGTPLTTTAAQTINNTQIASTAFVKTNFVASGSTATDAAVRYNGTTSLAGNFDGGTTAPAATTRLNYNGYLYTNRLYGAVYNDYAEFRPSKEPIELGRVAVESSGFITACKKRMSKAAMLTSDTYGFAIGEEITEYGFSIPIAVAGRVLVYFDKTLKKAELGDAVCSGANGTVSKMKWWERILFPERIIGTVSEIPTYTHWGSGNIEVKNRVWIKVR
jgi:hypothetical protein